MWSFQSAGTCQSSPGFDNPTATRTATGKNPFCALNVKRGALLQQGERPILQVEKHPRPLADEVHVGRGDGRNFRRRSGHEHFVRCLEVVERELLDEGADAKVVGEVDDRVAGDAEKDPAFLVVGEQAIAANKKQIFARAFRKITGIVEQQCLAEPPRNGILGGQDRIQVLSTGLGSRWDRVPAEFPPRGDTDIDTTDDSTRIHVRFPWPGQDRKLCWASFWMDRERVRPVESEGPDVTLPKLVRTDEIKYRVS
jgi:hypothetical protein